MRGPLKRHGFTLAAAISVVAFLFVGLGFLLSFLNFFGGCSFIGTFHESSQPSGTLPYRWKTATDVHREYRGVFTHDGRLAVGVLVLDTAGPREPPAIAPRQGFRRVTGVPNIPFVSTSLPGFDNVRIERGQRGSVDYCYAHCIRVHMAWLMLLTCVVPGCWIAKRLRGERRRAPIARPL